MKLHERVLIVEKASLEIAQFVLDISEKYGLTDGEYLKILSENLSNTAKYMIREERHPGDPDAKGGEA